MKILFYITTLGKGGAERVISNLSNYLSQRHEIYILTAMPNIPQYKINKEVNVIIPKDKLLYKIKGIRNIIQIKEFEKNIKEIKPDIIVSFMAVPSFCALYPKNKLKTINIVSVRNDPKQEYKGTIRQFIMKRLFKRADAFVFQTKEAKEYFSKDIQNKSTIIPNPLSFNIIKLDRCGNKKKKIVTVGRLEKQKNQKLLINAFYGVTKKHKDYELHIYGEGRLKNKLNNQIKKLHMQNNIILKGKVDDIEQHIRDATAFVLSSDYEGMPNALMEAMALGIACISTDCPCGGPRFLIENNVNGILIEPRNQEQLEVALNEIIEKEEFARSLEKNALKIKEKLEPTKIFKEWEDYILKVYAENKKI